LERTSGKTVAAPTSTLTTGAHFFAKRTVGHAFIAFMKSVVDFVGQIREHWGHYCNHRNEDLVIRSANRERIIYSH
jgi:hypothetical protein